MPLVLTDVISEWPAASKWKLNYFATTHGELPIVADDGMDQQIPRAAPSNAF